MSCPGFHRRLHRRVPVGVGVAEPECLLEVLTGLMPGGRGPHVGADEVPLNASG